MIKIICIGKIKESFIDAGINEYIKRIKPYHEIKIIELKEGNNKDIKKTKEQEASYILEKINKDDFVITLEINGKALSSEEFSQKLDNIFTYGKSVITFVIGGSWGLDLKVVERSDFHLSFSSFTFPHQLMRLILVEQLYRAFSIINHLEYHK